MRLFIAIDLDEDARRKAAGLVEALRATGANVKWSRPENLHITLKFLGEVDEGRVKEIEGAVKECVKELKPFTFTIEGIGHFGSEAFMKVVWLGITNSKDSILEMMESLDGRLDSIRKDQRPHSVHLTLGRPTGETGGLSGKIKEMGHVKLCEVEVKEVKIKRSVIGPGGPRYDDVACIQLGGSG